MTPTQELLQAASHSAPSPFGLSYYRRLLECPKKAKLNEMYEALQDPDEYESETTGGKLNWAHVGLFGHKLFELWCRGMWNLSTPLPENAPAELVQANTMFETFNSWFGDLAEFLGGKILGAEVPLGEHPNVQATCIGQLGGLLTGRADAIGELQDAGAFEALTGHFLEPGRWIIDYKFGQKHGANEALKFGSSLQAAAYCYLDELEQGAGKGAKGVLFLRIIGHKEMSREKSFACYVARPNLFDYKRLRSFMQLALAQGALGLGNPDACISMFGKECFFHKEKICPGF